MTEVNTRKFYQFLAQYQKDGSSWADVADSTHGNGDGTVIKSEFRAFLNAEWNGEENGELTNDLINSFWKKIDTNTSASKIQGTKLKNLNALDKNEMANLDKQLEVYVKFDEFVSNNVKIPTVLTSTGSQWKSDVTEELSGLLEKYIQGGLQGDLSEILGEALPSIANKCTAQYCAVEYQNNLQSSILKDYPDYKVADDSTLQALINAYIGTIDAETDAGTIQEEILSIMDAYLASAGLCEDSGYDLANLGYNKNNLNDIQIAVITQTIKNDLADEAKNYEGYETEFNEAVKQFIEAKIKEGGNFEELKASATDFATSEFKTKLDNMIKIDTTYKNVDVESDFYKALVEEFGESLANLISKDARYLDAYKKILEDVKTKVQNGELEMDKVSEYIIGKISDNLADFFPNGYSDMSLEELATTYDKMVEAANKQTDDEKSLTQHREAAINYCDAIAKKGTALKSAVEEVFGTTDYKSAINKMYPSEIESKIQELKKLVTSIGDVSTFEITEWNGLPEENLTMDPGSTQTFNISATINSNGATAPNVTYSVISVNGCTATCTALGELSITAGKTEGFMSVKVAVIADGVEIGTKTISLKAEKTIEGIANTIGNEAWGGTSEHLEVYGLPGLGDGKAQVTSQSFSDLYNNNAIIMLHMKNNNSDYTGTIKTRLTELCGYITNALASKGLDATKLKNASTKVIETLMSNYSRKGGSRNNTEGIALGTKVSNDIKNGTMTGVVKYTDFKGKDYQVNMVSFKEVVDMILKEYGY